MTVSVRPLEEGDIGPVVESSVRAWKPVFGSMCRVLGQLAAHPASWQAE